MVVVSSPCEHGRIDACADCTNDQEKDEYIRELELKVLFYERAWDNQAERLAERERQLAAADLAMQQIQAILRIRL